MGTGWVWGGFPPTQTDFFVFFKARFRVENGGAVLVVVKLKTAILKKFKFPSRFLWQTNLVWT